MHLHFAHSCCAIIVQSDLSVFNPGGISLQKFSNFPPPPPPPKKNYQTLNCSVQHLSAVLMLDLSPPPPPPPPKPHQTLLALRHILI